MVLAAYAQLSISFEQVTRARYEGASVDPWACMAHLNQVFADQRFTPHEVKGGTVYITRRKSGMGVYMLEAYDAPSREHGQLLGKAQAEVHVDENGLGYVSVENVRVSDRRRGIARTFYSQFNEALAPQGGRLVPTLAALESDGRKLWQALDPKALAVLDTYKYLAHEAQYSDKNPSCFVDPHDPAYAYFSESSEAPVQVY